VLHVRDAFSVWRARRALHGCDVVGARAHVDGTPWIHNEGAIEIGADFSMSSSPVPSHVVTGPHGRVRVGDRVHVGHGVAICSHAEISIGDGATIGPFAILLDVDFHKIGARGSTGDARPIRIGKNVRIGAGAVILRGAIVEDDAVIAPNSVVARRVPKGSCVAGVPARPSPVRRAS
jgi:maltose O-acetyltransferase